jgi:cyclophilin family peptidyl-prolyl cis-trans isomerase
MGYAYGQLFKEELPGMVKEFFSWADTYIQNNVTFVENLPDFMKKVVGKLGVGVAKKLL